MMVWKNVNGEIKAVLSKKLFFHENISVDFKSNNEKSVCLIYLKDNKLFHCEFDKVSMVELIQLMLISDINPTYVSHDGICDTICSRIFISKGETRTGFVKEIEKDTLFIDLEENEGKFTIKITTIPESLPILDIINEK